MISIIQCIIDTLNVFNNYERLNPNNTNMNDIEKSSFTLSKSMIGKNTSEQTSYIEKLTNSSTILFQPVSPSNISFVERKFHLKV